MASNPGILRILLCFILIPSFAQGAVRARSEKFRAGDGATLHYFDAGSDAAPAVVLIPGWTMPAEIFEPQINELSKRFRVIALDPRSQGESEKTAEGNYLERHAQDIHDLLQHLKLADVVLLGWSNGVPDVLTFVEQNGTSSLRGVILVDGFLNPGSPGLQKMIGGMLKTFQDDRAKFTDGFVRSMYASKQTEEYLQHIKDASLKTPTNTAVVEMFNVVSHGDFTPILAKLDKPVLYVCQPQLESQSKLVQGAIPGARVEIFTNAGHALFVDEPAHFNKVVGDFMDSLPAATK